MATTYFLGLHFVSCFFLLHTGNIVLIQSLPPLDGQYCHWDEKCGDEKVGDGCDDDGVVKITTRCSLEIVPS